MSKGSYHIINGAPEIVALSENEARLIETLERNEQNQRNLARSAGFSLGMTNLLLKRLVHKGYVKVVQLNGRTLRYILTPKGFQEKIKRTNSYLRRSIQHIRKVRTDLLEILEQESAYKSEICLIGRGELFDMIVEILSSIDLDYKVYESGGKFDANECADKTLVLNCSDEAILLTGDQTDSSIRVVNVGSISL